MKRKFLSGDRIAVEFVSGVIVGKPRGTMFATYAPDHFVNFVWKTLFTVQQKAFRPFLMPNMVYFRTFRCSERATQHFAAHNVRVPDLFRAGDTITQGEVAKAIQKLAERNDCMVLLGFKNFPDKIRAHMGAALVIDCIPLLKCEFCRKSSIKTMPACSACKMTYYCNKECQTKHWADHKKECPGWRAKR